MAKTRKATGVPKPSLNKALPNSPSSRVEKRNGKLPPPKVNTLWDQINEEQGSQHDDVQEDLAFSSPKTAQPSKTYGRKGVKLSSPTNTLQKALFFENAPESSGTSVTASMVPTDLFGAKSKQKLKASEKFEDKLVEGVFESRRPQAQKQPPISNLGSQRMLPSKIATRDSRNNQRKREEEEFQRELEKDLEDNPIEYQQESRELGVEIRVFQTNPKYDFDDDEEVNLENLDPGTLVYAFHHETEFYHPAEILESEDEIENESEEESGRGRRRGKKKENVVKPKKLAKDKRFRVKYEDGEEAVLERNELCLESDENFINCELYQHEDQEEELDQKRSAELRDQMKEIIHDLIQIHAGKLSCQRHKDFHKGGKFKEDLKAQIGFGPFSLLEFEATGDILLELFNEHSASTKIKKGDPYIMSVLVPEAIVRLIQLDHQNKNKNKRGRATMTEKEANEIMMAPQKKISDILLMKRQFKLDRQNNS